VTVVGQDFDGLLEQEKNPGLGNGGLGRLADCYTDSLVSVNVPTIRYCMWHQFSIGDQEIRDGWQIPGPVNFAYHDQERWIFMSILNVARMGKFSSESSIRE